MDSCRSWRQDDVLQSLAQLHKGARGVVSAIAGSSTAAASGAVAASSAVAWSSIERRLMELGFIPGERIEVIEEVRPGGDPMAVRIGSSVFALRRREARAVMVKLEQS